MAALRSEAETANLFAREMAHRLKNALTIVQSIAFQTLGVEAADGGKFAGRLKALADANELLTEHWRCRPREGEERDRGGAEPV